MNMVQNGILWCEIISLIGNTVYIMDDVIIPTYSDKFYEKPLNLDITNKCPLECPACHRQSIWYNENRHHFIEMTIEDFKKILETFSYIEFSGQQSDPIAHSNFLEFLTLAYSHKLDIHTAASHRKKDFYEEAYHRCGFNTSWIFGLDGLPEESHKYRIHQNGTHLYEMMKLGVDIGCNIIWQYIVFNYNQDHIEQAKQMAKDDGIKFKLSFSSRWKIEPNNGQTMEIFKPRDEYCAKT